MVLITRMCVARERGFGRENQFRKVGLGEMVCGFAGLVLPGRLQIARASASRVYIQFTIFKILGADRLFERLDDNA